MVFVLLRPGRGDRHGVRPDRDVAGSPPCTPPSASARSPARSWSPTTCATSRPTATPARYARRPARRRRAPARLLRAAALPRRSSPWSASLSPRRGGPCSRWGTPPRRARAARVVRSGAVGPGADPGAPAHRRRRAALRPRPARRPGDRRAEPHRRRLARMFWFILLVVVVAGFVVWKLRAPLLAKVLGQDRVAHRPPAQPARSETRASASESTTGRQSTSSLARISSNFSAARRARSSTWRAKAVRCGLSRKYDARPLMPGTRSPAPT